MNRAFAVFIACLTLYVGGCATSLVRVDVFSAALHEPYRLGGGDKLRIIVFGQDTLSNLYAIDGTGRVTIPLIGPVPAGGATTQQLAHLVEARLREGYIRDPRVSIEVDTYRPFFVLGEVTAAGQFAYVNGLTVQNAIAIAGGYTARGDQTYAEVTRVINGQLVTAAVPMTHPVRPGDTIKVKERWF